MSRGLSKWQLALLRALVDRDGHTKSVGEAAWSYMFACDVEKRPYYRDFGDDRRFRKEALTNAKRAFRSLERRGLVTLEIRPGPPPSKEVGPFGREPQYQRDQYWATATEAGLAIGRREAEAYRKARPEAEAKRAEFAARINAL